jgi:hypothetical protein
MRFNKYIYVFTILLTILAACGDDHDHAFDPTAAVVGLADGADVQVSLTGGGGVLFRGRVSGDEGVSVLLTNTGTTNRIIVSRNGVVGKESDLPAAAWYRIPHLEFHNEDADGKTLVLIKLTTPDLADELLEWHEEDSGVLFDGLSTGSGWPQPVVTAPAVLKVNGATNNAVSWVNHSHDH